MQQKSRHCGVGIFFVEIVKSVIIRYVELVPIVKTCALELAVVDLKSERADEVQGSTDRGAGAGNISRVLRDLRLKKYNIYIHFQLLNLT